MLDEMGDRVDAVIVGTPDHTHAVAAMAAMRAGKHVYCEKPLAHTVAEVRALRAEARKRKIITQVGNYGHSSEQIRLFCEWVWDGAIGNVSEVHIGCGPNKDIYCQTRLVDGVRLERPAAPGDLDWDLWLGPVAGRPYHPAYVPVNWRGWMPFGSGALGDWVCHVVDPVFWALDLDMPGAIRAETTGYDPARQGEVFPAGATITFEFPAKGRRGPVKLVWFEGDATVPRPPELEPGRRMSTELGFFTGAIVIGDKGKIMYGSHGAGGCRIIPEAKMKAYKLPRPSIPRVKLGHHGDWIDAIHEGRQASTPFDYAGRLSEVGLLGVIAIRMAGRRLEYDERAMRFPNCPEADVFLRPPPYRDAWRTAGLA
jgi:predicted dehydrogenase